MLYLNNLKKGILMDKLNYSPELRKEIESFLKERKRKCLLEVFFAVFNTFFFILIFREVASFVAWPLYFSIMIECIAFFHLFSVDHILRPRFKNGVMLTRGSEQKLLLSWAMKKGESEFRRVSFLISEALEQLSESVSDQEEE